MTSLVSPRYDRQSPGSAATTIQPAVSVFDRNLMTVRGIACFLVVAYHVVGIDEMAGMHVSNQSIWHYAVDSLELIRMPAFTVLSGYLYARRRVDSAGFAVFWQKKARHLLVPLVFVSAVTWALRAHVYGASDRLVDALFFHYQHFWFLQAILIVFAAITIWDCAGRPGWVGLVLAMFGLVEIGRSIDPIDFLSISGAMYLAPYFIFGILLREHRSLFVRDDLILFAIGAVVIVTLVHQGGLNAALHPLSRIAMSAAICGMAGTLLMLRFMPVVPVFEKIGGYSYSIYLWHSIAGASARTLVTPYLGSWMLPLFLAMLAAGIGLPILLHRLVRDIPVLQTLMIGQGRRKAGTASLRNRRNVDADLHRLRARAEHDAINRGNLRIVATDRHDDMVAGHPDAIGRIDAHPAAYRPAPDQHPGMGGVRADKSLLPRRGNGADVA